ncbi:MAG: processing protein [Actinomycetota bacterium]|nr:processing protein [Actinomycetota bacterium]
MTMFGLKEAEVATLVRGVGGDELDREAIRDRFARATWTGIAEPGDRTAGLVVDAFGAAAALDAVVERWSAERWLVAAKQAGADEIPGAEFQQAIDRWQPRLKSASALLALRHAARLGARLLTPDVEGWPTGLADLGFHAPIALWVRGTDAALASLSTSISLVGARAATGYGEHVAMEASAGLVDRGFAIVSGAAYGIDGMAHRAALASHGMTVAFLAGGVDRLYPSGHDTLLARIIESGAVISELPCGQPPTRWRFLQRNRLIAAASQATIVLEAGWRSGSLNTAGHAAQVGRPLGAVPGPVTSAASAGCHRLIRDYGATLVTTAEEMAELVPYATGLLLSQSSDDSSGPKIELVEIASTPDETRLLDALSLSAPRTPIDLAARAGLSATSVQSLLATLELDGRVIEREHGWLAKKPEDPNKPPPKLN